MESHTWHDHTKSNPPVVGGNSSGRIDTARRHSGKFNDWFFRVGETHWPIATVTILAAWLVSFMTTRSSERDATRDRVSAEQVAADRLRSDESEARIGRATATWTDYFSDGRTLVSQLHLSLDNLENLALMLRGQQAITPLATNELVDKQESYRRDIAFTEREFYGKASAVRLTVGDRAGVCAIELATDSAGIYPRVQSAFASVLNTASPTGTVPELEALRELVTALDHDLNALMLEAAADIRAGVELVSPIGDGECSYELRRLNSTPNG